VHSTFINPRSRRRLCPPGTPNLEARIARLQDKLDAALSRGSTAAAAAAASAPTDVKARALAVARTYFTHHWDAVRYLTFAENDAVVGFVVDAVASRGEVTEAQLAAKVAAVARTLSNPILF